MWQRTKYTHGTVNEGRSHVDAKTEALVFNLLFNQQPVLLAVRDFSRECKTDSSKQCQMFLDKDEVFEGLQRPMHGCTLCRTSERTTFYP